MKHILLTVAVVTMAILFARPAAAQIRVVNTDDANTSNDTSAGPDATGDRNDFFEVRNYDDLEGTTRKKIGYVKFDISTIDSALYPTAVLSGLFDSGRDGTGPITIFGLNDGEDNLDDVSDGSFNEENWTEGALTYSMGLGVDTSVLTTDGGNMGLDMTEVTQLGVMNSLGDGVFLTNTTDAPLGNFLSQDTNGVVTFLLADIRDGSAPDGNTTEWRITAREASEDDSLQLEFFPTLGDTDLDGVVELLDDLNPIRMNYNMAGIYTDGDLNSDGFVTFADFRIWKTAYLQAGGSLSGADLSFLNIPEPSSALLVLIGLLSVLPNGRSRR